jgi:hypothetical protein
MSHEYRAPHLFRLAMLSSVSLMAISACTPQQEAAASLYATETCHIVTAAEAADPAFVSHNGKVIAGQTLACTLVPPALAAASASQTPVPVTVTPAPANAAPVSAAPSPAS